MHVSAGTDMSTVTVHTRTDTDTRGEVPVAEASEAADTALALLMTAGLAADWSQALMSSTSR